MAKEIDKLDPIDRGIILRAPAVVAILAAVSDDGIVSDGEKTDAIRLAHLRTYTSKPILHNYYKEVDKCFKADFDNILAQLPEGWKEKERFLENRLTNLDPVLQKLDSVYAEELIASLKSFAKHVFKSNSNFLQNFLLPIFTIKMNDGFDPKIGGR
ncbi:MAG: hypothetical protein ACJAV5_001045 [Vicingaceae bacterium]|jgi:hypothetical protein